MNQAVTDPASSTSPSEEPDAPPRRALRRVLVACAVVFVALSVCLVVVREVGGAEGFAWRMRPGWMGIAIVGFVCLHLLHAELWRRVVAAMGVRVALPRAWSVWCTSTLARYVPTGMLMIVVRVALGARAGIPTRLSTSAVLHEAAMAFVGALVLSGAFFVQLDAWGDGPARFGILAIPLLAIAALHPRILDPLVDRLLRRLGREPLDRTVTLPMRTLGGFTALYAASFVLAGLSLYALVQALVGASADNAIVIVAAFAVGYNASVLGAVVPGGLGIREAGLAAALTPVMPAAAAVGVAVSVRLVQLAIELLSAGVAALWTRRQTTQQA